MRTRKLRPPVTMPLMFLIAIIGLGAGVAYGEDFRISGGKIHYMEYVLTPDPLLPFDSKEKLGDEEGIYTTIDLSPDENWAVLGIYSIGGNPSQSWLIDRTKKTSPVKLNDHNLIKTSLPIRGYKSAIWHPQKILELKYEIYPGPGRKSLVVDLTDTEKVQYIESPLFIDFANRVFVTARPWRYGTEIMVFIRRLFSDELIEEAVVPRMSTPRDLVSAEFLPEGKLKLTLRFSKGERLIELKKYRPAK